MKHILQAAPVEGREGPSKESFAGEHDRIGKDNARLKKIHAAIEFEGPRGKVISGQIRQGEVMAPEIALVG